MMMSFVIVYSYCSSTWTLSLRRIATQLSLWHLQLIINNAVLVASLITSIAAIITMIFTLTKGFPSSPKQQDKPKPQIIVTGLYTPSKRRNKLLAPKLRNVLAIFLSIIIIAAIIVTAVNISQSLPPSLPTQGSLLHIFRGHGGFIKSIAWSPDSTRIVSAGFDNTIQVWDVLDEEHTVVYSDPSDARVVAWSPNGKFIALGGLDTKVYVWDANTGNNVYIYHGHSKQSRL